MASDLSQRKLLKFLIEHLQSQELFTVKDLAAAAGWTKPGTYKTYWSKQIKPFVAEVKSGQFRVTEGFRPFMTWKKFKRHASQNRPVAADYSKTTKEYPVIFEFFMPLTNETALRTTLDTLFYKDNVISKLKVLDEDELIGHFPDKQNESSDAYYERASIWIGNHFGGYSIFHVDGRFRAWKLATRDEALKREKQGYRYLVDETTAVTRFIFPCDGPEEAQLVRYFFEALFVESIIQLINAEDEIWMVESGDENRIHIWSVDDDGDDGEFDPEQEDDGNGEEEGETE
jgi:hypothetical protein